MTTPTEEAFERVFARLADLLQNIDQRLSRIDNYMEAQTEFCKATHEATQGIVEALKELRYYVG